MSAAMARCLAALRALEAKEGTAALSEALEEFDTREWRRRATQARPELLDRMADEIEAVLNAVHERRAG